MLSFSTLLLLLFVPAFAGMGVVGAHWARCGHCAVRTAQGRWLYAVIVFFVGLLALLAANLLHQTLLGFALVLGGLFMAMCWDGPAVQAADL